MSPTCPEFEKCTDRRVQDAEHRGAVLSKLESIEKVVSALWKANETNRQDIKSLYFKIGLITGGTSLAISLGVAIVMKKV